MIRLRRPTVGELGRTAVWIAIALPAAYQLVLLITAIAGRVAYPYDLEWMEGGMLHHALRIQQGQGIYVPPSIDFIPYLYTPLYPGLLALLGNAVGLSYTLGRAISVTALLAIAVVAVGSIAGSRHQHVHRGPGLAGSALALGLFAATYPFVEGWFDLVRGDTLFLAIATIGIAACARWAAIGGDDGREPEIRVGVAATILVLGFFTKQTGLFYVALGGAVVLVISWRRAIAYVVVAGMLGLGLTWLLNWISDGWFWIYASKIHRAHDFNMDRFWASFGKILWHFPALTFVVAATLVAVAAATWVSRAPGQRPSPPPQTRPFLLWTATFAVSTLVGAIGWGTEFAHFNAYMPAFLHGGLAAGAALPALAASARILVGRPGAWAERAALIVPALAGVALGVTLLRAPWHPEKFVPTDADVAAGDKLIRDIHAIPGEVWMPSHPWYVELAGKTPHVHRMGIKDVTAREPRPVRGLDDALRNHAFSAIVFDNSDLPGDGQPELAALRQLIAQSYRIEARLPPDEQPHVYTGAQVHPEEIWVPAVPATPPVGAHALFDFEQPSWDGWTRTGTAWGRGPATDVPGVSVLGTTGRRFASSVAGGGDAATGRLVSPAFPLHAARITLKIGGTVDPKLRVELEVVDDSGIGAVVRTASVAPPGGPTLQEVGWDVRDVANQMVRLVLVDESQARGGYLVVDDVWSWDR